MGLLLLFLGSAASGGTGCWSPLPEASSTRYRPPTDPGFGGGAGSAKNRPEVLVSAGVGTIGGTGAYVVRPFFLDVFEITVAAYRECLNSTDADHCQRVPTGPRLYRCTYSETPGSNDALPMNCIDWQQAAEFCRWAGRRLPTEVEREYAAYGGADKPPSKYPWGADEPLRFKGSASNVDKTLGELQLAWTPPFAVVPAGRSPRRALDKRGPVLEYPPQAGCTTPLRDNSSP